MRVAKALIRTADGTSLILRRSGTHPTHAYEADLPGGIIECGERYEDGLAREIFEEAGFHVDPASLRLVATKRGHSLVEKRLYTIDLKNTPEVTISWEHDQWRWVPNGQLASALTGTDSYMQFVKDQLEALY